MFKVRQAIEHIHGDNQPINTLAELHGIASILLTKRSMRAFSFFRRSFTCANR